MFKSLLFWLAVEVLSPCQKLNEGFLKQSIAPFTRPWTNHRPRNFHLVHVHDQETSDGGVVTGQYSVVLPDGSGFLGFRHGSERILNPGPGSASNEINIVWKPRIDISSPRVNINTYERIRQ